MRVTRKNRRRSGRARPKARPGLRLERLEARDLPAAPAGLVSLLGALDPGDTLDRAQLLDLSGGPVGVRAALGDSPAGASDVDWYSFTLAAPAHVSLSTLDPSQGGTAPCVLSLYNSTPVDPLNPLGHRLLAQAEGGPGVVGLDRDLAGGTYYLAVSGAGNRSFHPLIADSGYPGATGDYGVVLEATDLPATLGPSVLASDPAPGTALDSSPLVLRVSLSGDLDPNSISLGDTVWLTYNPNGTFGDGNDLPVALAGSHFDTTAHELQVSPAAPLAPGYYQLYLAGDSSAGFLVLTDPAGDPLGADALHPLGQDTAVNFQVAGVEGNTAPGAGADDTPAGAHDLGVFAGSGQVQVAGAIGDDPTDPVGFNPADVDLYHFRVSGPDRYAVVGEVFAHRIGSPLDSGVSLFWQDPADGSLHLVAGNDNTGNTTPATNGTVPLFSDSVVFAGLTAGDYYLAVSSRRNVPDADLGLFPGVNGIFDPAVSHSGARGVKVGPYVLNLALRPEGDPPHVVATSPASGDVLAAPPTRLVVRFDEPVNVQELAFRAFEATGQGALPAVYVQGADGTRYFPRLESYDPFTAQATFLMVDALPNGVYALYLSGTLGLADIAGNPLVGNDPGGDYVVRFSVSGPARGTGGNPLVWTDQEPNDTIAAAQDLGVLFPVELQAGVTLVRDFSASAATAPADQGDYYRFTVLQGRLYLFNFSGSGLPAGASVELLDAAGNLIPTTSLGTGLGVRAFLDPGVYVVRVGGWQPAQAPAVVYQLRINLGGAPDNPTPLTVGPRPASTTTLITVAPPPANLTIPAPPTPPTSPTLSLGPGLLSAPASGGALDPRAVSLAPLVFLVTLTPLGADFVSQGDQGGATTGGAFSVPPSLLLGLGTSAVGGLTESGADSPPADRPAVLTNPMLPEDLVPGGTGSPGDSGKDEDPSSARDLLRLGMRLWTSALEAILAGWHAPPGGARPDGARSLDRLWERVRGALGSDSGVPAPSGTSADEGAPGEEEAQELGLREVPSPSTQHPCCFEGSAGADEDSNLPGDRWASAVAALAAGLVSAGAGCPRERSSRRQGWPAGRWVDG
jgi:hypothetical protein